LALRSYPLGVLRDTKLFGLMLTLRYLLIHLPQDQSRRKWQVERKALGRT
jgi:hypothetical protein